MAKLQPKCNPDVYDQVCEMSVQLACGLPSASGPFECTCEAMSSYHYEGNTWSLTSHPHDSLFGFYLTQAQSLRAASHLTVAIMTRVRYLLAGISISQDTYTTRADDSTMQHLCYSVSSWRLLEISFRIQDMSKRLYMSTCIRINPHIHRLCVVPSTFLEVS